MPNAIGRPRAGNNLRQLVRNGNSTHVSIPSDLLLHMRWRAGDRVVLGISDVDTLTIRLARGSDLRAPGLPVPISSPLDKVTA